MSLNKCAECGRKLKDPVSTIIGFGPICRQRWADWRIEPFKKQVKAWPENNLLVYWPSKSPMAELFAMKIKTTGKIYTNVPMIVKYPIGVKTYDWPEGDGATCLAINMVELLMRDHKNTSDWKGLPRNDNMVHADAMKHYTSVLQHEINKFVDEDEILRISYSRVKNLIGIKMMFSDD